MRGLAFPTTAVYEREDSYDHGTPFSGVDDIPIDPALSTSLDPALLGEGGSRGNGQGPTPLSYIPYPNIQHKRQWSPGPQGDPFAPQPMPSYMSIEEPSRPNPKPPKKKRKFIRETECGFCQGGDTKNNVGVAEQLLTCSECGRSGHPTCLGLEELDDVVRSYAWKCVECKNCEVCQEKGGDTRMLFCDVCDRGWHMECLQPPLTEEPPGKWNCPMCPSPEYLLQDVPPEFYPGQTLEPDCAASHPLTSPLRHRETSVASSSRSAARAFSKQKRKGKARATATDESEVEVDIDLTVENGAVSSTSKRPPKGKSRWKGKTPMKDRPSVIEEVPEPDPDPDVTRPAKRMRLRLTSPVPPSKTPVPSTPKITPIIRLKLGPPKDKGKFREEETEEPKKGIFDDVLSLEDRDTTQTTMKENDKLRFERSRAAAEAKLYPPPTSAIPPEAEEDPIPGPSSRPLRSHHSVLPSAPTPGPSASPAPSTPVTTFNTSEKLLRIRSIRFGEYEIQTWYDAPFPEEYATIPDGQLWICEFCLKYMKSRFVASRHQLKCKMRHPPGDEIYRDGAISIYEVDGRKNKIYCQNLCLLSKMFLDHKSLFYDVEPFLFYVMTEVDDIGSRFVGYFSKEKRSPKDYNVSCIMTLPVRQRQGWGNLLIDFSYLLSKKEQRPGSPEKPLSALGALGYRNYWTLALMRYLHTAPPDPRLEDISTATSLTIEDICTTLSQQRMIAIQDATPPPKPLPGQTIKFPKGRKNGIARKHLQRTITQDDEKVKGPFVLPRSYKIHWNPEVVEHYLARWEAKGYLKLKLEGLKWSPFLIARTKKSDVLDPDVIVEGSEVDAYAQNGGGHTNAVSETPGTPGPLKAVKAVNSRTDSPAAALFDDDTVETIIPAHTAATSDPDELPVVQISSSARSLRRPSQVDTPDLEREPKPSETERTSAPVSPTISPRKRAVPNTPLRRSRRTSSGTGTASHPIEVEREDLTAEKEKERPSLRRRRTRSGLPKVPNGQDMSQSVSVDPSVADDAALAAKLAMEDRPRRQLRSRSNTDQQEPKKPTALPLPPTRSISPRKRKRVGSPSTEPEPDEEPTPTNPRITRRTSMKVNRPQAPLPKAKRGPSPVKSRVKAIPALSTPTPSRPRRTSSRFMTGAPTPNPPLRATSQRRRRIPSSSPVRSPSIAPGPEQEREQEQEQEREVINVDEDAKVTSPVYSDRIHIHDSPDAMSEGDPNPNLQQEDAYDPLFDDPLEGLESLPEGSIVDAEPQLPFEHGTGEPAEPDPEQDVKLENEDMGTPLTGVTSSYGQSVPSDYTVIAEEIVNSGNVIMAKGSPTSPTVTLNGEVPAEEVDVEMVSPEAQKVGSCRRDLADIVPPKPSKVIVEGVVSLLDEDEDADAEGEPDIDADGEVDDGGVDVDLDAEGEVVDDLDAEGEPDDDAEGEPDIDLDGDVAVVVSS